MKNSKFLIIAAFFSIYIIWGSTYLFNKIAVTEIPPLFLASIRFSIAGVLIMMLAKIMKLPLKISRNQLVNSGIAGFLFLVYGNGVFVWALKYVDSGFAALLASTQPLFVLFLLRLIDGKRLQKKSIIGVLLGLIGMYLLVSQQEITTSEGSVLGIFMILTCVLSWSYGSVFVSKADLPKNHLVSTGYQMLLAGFMLAIASLVFKETWISPLNWSSKTQGAMFFLIIFGGIVAFTAFNYLLKSVSPEKVATSAYVNPIIALFLGWSLLNEQLTSQSIVASAVLLLGVYFINSRKKVVKVLPKKGSF
ncbi:EamA family transporter [Tenacibaculum finnmarkense]|uniref:EamA family transporter n=1 Tax=Tenacibaculum finnmarkense TaxID=2781243 RepID=UPI001E5A0263|nr:EamA family transporter [Tenacibaculum finnmarkense]MCD8400013.1 EamA family transporter [Tenacibaculum finnmarkense genomovar ulcerans]MCD8422730.1 EamA family transporter [Tenacibaculum finnmarkense genomovar ulcerans]MCD8432623.1 EamA family transporter [Tenacibaculum finnmarkense genomovar ulcerans]MCG8236328.1 EamA family transporter [Tenacibaculum finnmarkense genomovar ulcerans]MCG8238733.1 EamA family transporter [Tenacibaculum finnmarkense genomovar ulcerans]